MQQLDRSREADKREKALRAEEERSRHKFAITQAKKDQLTAVLKETLATKKAKLNYMHAVEANKQKQEEENQKQAENVRQQKIAGQAIKKENSRFTYLHDELQKEQAELIAQTAIDLDKASKEF